MSNLCLWSLCIKVCEQYVAVTRISRTVCVFSTEFRRHQLQLSVNHVCLVNEIHNLYRIATKKPIPEGSFITAIKSEGPKLETLLTTALGSHHGPYAQALDRLRATLAQLIESFGAILKALEKEKERGYIKAESHHTPPRPMRIVKADRSECKRLLERLWESTQSLVIIRRLALGKDRLDLPMHEEATIPDHANLVLTAYKVLHKATKELVRRDEYSSDLVGQMASLSLERKCCQGATATLSFGNQNDRRSAIRFSFHLDPSLQSYGDNFLHKSFRYIPQSRKKNHLPIPGILLLGACDSDFIRPCDLDYSSNYSEKNKDITEDVFLDRESVAVYVIDNIYPDTPSIDGSYNTSRNTCNCYSCFQRPRKNTSRKSPGQLSSSTKRSSQKLEPQAGIILTRDTRETKYEIKDLSSLLSVYDSMRPQVCIMDQLLLAYSLSSLILDLYTTPWLKDDWRLDDIALCKPLDEDILITNQSSNPPLLCLRDGLQQTEMYSSSVRLKRDPDGDSSDSYKKTFYNLGVALLEIAYLKPFSFLKNGTKANGSAAEKVLMWQNPLGLKYQHIIERCLRGDLGAGPNPTSDEIRISAYTHIVSALHNMIQYLSQ